MDAGKRGGKPCIRGLRITVYEVLEYLASGMSQEEILKHFPDLEAEDIKVCLSFAADRERKLFTSQAWNSFIDPIAGKNPMKVLVESSAISSISYDPKSLTLDIEFKSSETYRYFDVPNDEYQGLLAADSKGAYLNSEIKPKYRTRKLL